MIILSLIILILITALPSFFKFFPENCYNRISAIVLLFCAILTFNTLDLESIGSGIAIYSGLFHITINKHFKNKNITIALQRSHKTTSSYNSGINKKFIHNSPTVIGQARNILYNKYLKLNFKY